MPFKFNPFSGNFDQTGSGGGGSSYIDGEVQNFSALPETLGSPAVDSAYLVREAEGAWLLNRKPSGIYIRTANTGTRANDWTYAGEFPDVFNDANLVVYSNGDSSKNLAFNVGGISTGTTRTITVPDKNITLDDAGDTRTPTAHAASHAAAGSDPLAPSDIGAQSIFSVESLVITTTAQVTLTAARAKIYDIVQYASAAVDVKLPSTNAIQGDVVVLRWGTGSNSINVVQSNSPAVITTVSSGEQKRFIRGSTDSWSLVPVDTHTHAASAITSGTLDIARIPTGTGSTQVAAGNHTHELTALAATGATNGHVLTANGSGGVTFAAASGGDTVSIDSTAADILSATSGAISADDAGADRLVFWDDSANKLTYLEAGSGLSISGTTLTATASGGSKTYAVFTATDHQPPATDFATLDTRNSVAVLDFSDTATESAVFVGVMPEGAVLTSGLIVRLHWMGTATTGNVRWSVAFERGNTDLDIDSFDTATTATATTNGTSGIVTVTAITCTNIDSIAAGDLFRLRVQRLGADAADTMTGAKGCELVAVEVRSAA